MLLKRLVTQLATVAYVEAFSKGFNSGAAKTDNSAKSYDDFKAEFEKAQNLPGTSSWNSVRLYTNIQSETTTDPISAFQAAIDTNTTMLLGIWTSAGADTVQNELVALKSAIKQHGSKFTDLVVGISVGSEDLYRNSEVGMNNDAGIGIEPSVLSKYIRQTRRTLSDTALSNSPIGHVDTWDAWANSTNDVIVANCDWIGMDTYPYFEYQKDNDISNAKQLFWNAYNSTKAIAAGKEVWITETGWPVSGKKSGKAKASHDNARQYWQEIACELQDNYHVWWYIIQDAIPDTPNPSFGLVGKDISSSPLYDLSCTNSSTSESAAPHLGTSAAMVGLALGAGFLTFFSFAAVP